MGVNYPSFVKSTPSNSAYYAEGMPRNPSHANDRTSWSKVGLWIIFELSSLDSSSTWTGG